MSDPGKYRTKDELEERKKRDPLARARDALVDGGAGEKLAALEADVEPRSRTPCGSPKRAPSPTPDLLEPTTYAGPFAR